jgi:hypothetical protein
MNTYRRETAIGLPSPELFRPRSAGGARSWKRWGAAAGFVGGVGLGVVGVALYVLAGLVAEPTASRLTTAGNVALLSLIPLLVAGAHCLDAIERELDAREPADEEPAGEAEITLPAPPENVVYFRRRATRAIGAVALLGLGLGNVQPAHAQQTLFNVPTADVLDKGKVYGELDVSWKPVDPEFSSFVPRVVVGVGHRVEVGLNVTGNVQPGPDATALVPAFKWKVYDGGDNGWAIVAGDHVFVPVHNKSYDVGNYVYAEVSKTFAPSGTRVTAGSYHFSDDVVAPGAQRAGGQFGVEQPINRYLSFQADWFTGKHASGYFTPGFVVKPHPKVTIYAGYSIGNTGVSQGNHYFLTEIGFNFN